MFEKDSLISGLIIGIVIPFVGFAIWLEVYDQLESAELVSSFGKVGDFRRRTCALLGICLNLIPFTIFNRWRYTYSMRGVMIPTIIYGFIWFFYFGVAILEY